MRHGASELACLASPRMLGNKLGQTSMRFVIARQDCVVRVSMHWFTPDVRNFVRRLDREQSAHFPPKWTVPMQECSRCSIIAHSMGNRLVVSALQDLLPSPGSPAPRSTEVDIAAHLLSASTIIFAAPDICSTDFKKVLEGAGPVLTSPRTLYLSANDFALQLSAFGHAFVPNGFSRAGLQLSISAAYDSIDASFTWTYRQASGHRYFAQSAAVTRDLQRLFAEQPPVAAVNRLHSNRNQAGTLRRCVCSDQQHVDRHFEIMTYN